MFPRRILDEVTKDLLVVIAYEDYLADPRYFGDGFETVPDDRVACDVEEWLAQPGSGQSKGQSICVALTLGTSRDKGLNRVPREGPPT